MQKYIQEEPTFEDTVDQVFLVEAFSAIREDKLMEFKLAVSKLHKSNNLDKWRINVFTKIQGKITGGVVLDTNAPSNYPNNQEINNNLDINWK